MVKREHTVIDLTADEDGGDPVAQRAKVEEPDHLICPITREMFRNPVMLVESGQTYERAAIERHLRLKCTDPSTNVPIKSTRVMTNRNTRMAVEAWLDDNPDVTPDGWDKPEMLPPFHRAPAQPMEYHRPDLEVLREWRESCPELGDLWREDDHVNWTGVTWYIRGDVYRVTQLRLSERGLSGQLPRLGGLTSLERVHLSCNQLSGAIPEKLFEGLTSLQRVMLNSNQLSGPIPEKLFEGLTSLDVVFLNDNQLTGPIPEKLFEGLSSLIGVWLDGNQLSGPIPEKLFEGLTSLEYVNLDNNQLTGPIPEKLFEGLTSLEFVELNTNQLSGSIPEKLFESLTSLEDFLVNLSGNQLTGPIPERLLSVVKL